MSDAQEMLAAALRRDVEALCANGPRTLFRPASLRAAAAFIEEALRRAGHTVQRQTFRVEAEECSNLIVEMRGHAHPERIYVIGAHYDSVAGSPGADDNASGVAALLAMARRMSTARPAATMRWVAFVNEEPPFFTTEAMGSLQYAGECHARGERIDGMLSLESIGYFKDEPGSQRYPPPLNLFYPSAANFIGFAGNLRSRAFIARCAEAFRRHSAMPVQSAALPELIAEAGWSDQWSFWRFGWPAFMVTDTAPFRNPHYHAASDLPDTLDYERLARVVEGLTAVAEELGG